MNDYSQNTFISHWNKTSKHLLKKGIETDTLPDGFFSGGACCGIAFALAEHIKNGEERTFYDFYNMICEQDPADLANRIDENSHLNGVIDFISMIYVMQENQQGESWVANTTKETELEKIARLGFCSANHNRIGSPLPLEQVYKEFDMVLNKEFCNLQNILETINNHDSMHIAMVFTDLGEAHSILVYKLNDKYHLFDMNVGKVVSSQNAEEAARELIYSTNLNYTLGTKKMDIFYSIRQSSLATQILCYTVLLPIVLLWYIYDVFFAKPLSDEQLKAGPLSPSIELSWSIIKANPSLSSSPCGNDSAPEEAPFTDDHPTPDHPRLYL